MDTQRLIKLKETIFERLVSGENADELHAQLSSRVGEQEATILIREAQERIYEARKATKFAKYVKKMRKRRLVGQRYLAWKLLTGLALLNSLIFLNPMGLIIACIGFALIEWREQVRMNNGIDEVRTSQPI